MNFGIVVFNQVEELDFVGPWEMLTMWSKFADGPANCWRLSPVLPEKRPLEKCNSPLSITLRPRSMAALKTIIHHPMKRH